uniref:uncharacterized protein LOC114597345 isoform X1 n=2 Tax=Podarcis muralis TaxID=64176 RepID=UPI0010A03094|nr:uncharacterized protein LOC114597345 isoform X1 [Podarcis muralis]XP_028585665.1 uncharacterized protein LOC114597345 isoform X1 [Podarcis muralis]
MVKKNSIPAGWRTVSPIGQPIAGTRFIPFKAPMKGEINQRLTPTQKFTPKDLIAAIKALNIELGLIIDLTYTTRYYHMKDLPKNVVYKKLYTIGFEVPDDPTILQFKKLVRKFLWENAENAKLIGVHCTNGINRTGYLICRYLIDVEGWDPETAIQAFGEARGHHIDGKIYLADLKTQPMRSNLGMNLWDADGDIAPPPNDIDGHIDRFPNEEYPRPGKRVRVFDYGHNELPEQVQLREFDFINKGPGQRRKPYHDHQFQDDLQPLVQISQRHFPDRQYYDDDYQEEMRLMDLRGSEHRLSPFHDQFSDDFPGRASPEDLSNVGRDQRQIHFPDIPVLRSMLLDTEVEEGHVERRRPFYEPQPNDGFQPHVQLKDLTFHKRSLQRLRRFHDCPPHDDMQPPVGDFEFVSRGHGQRMAPFPDHQHHIDDLQREVPLEDFDDRDSGSRCRRFHGDQSYSDIAEETQLKGFRNRGPFNDHMPHDDVPCEEYLERGHPFLSHEHFTESPLLHRENDYNRDCRPDCPEDYRRSRPSNDEINKGRKTGFAPYPSQPVHHSSSVQQKVSSVSVDPGRELQHKITRETEQRQILPVVTIDYNYGLPLDYASEDEDRSHYDLPPKQHQIWK